ncbi:MAG: hypothetical protein A2020_09525 [Lentisphaerae bacterium GWF2_45_14]|nr:MAG: hypothetical protein A2020_09525 [Lentisphaerae bacterium GWF2_45_14]
MNNPAVSQYKDAQKTAVDIIESAVDIKFNSADDVHIEYGMGASWLTRPFAVITHILKGSSRLYFDMDSSHSIDRSAGATTFISAGAWRKSEVLSVNGAHFVWVRASFTLFGGLDLLNFFYVPRIFPKSSSAAFRGLLKRVIELENDGKMPILEKAVSRKMLLYKILSLVLEHSQPNTNTLELLTLAQRLSPAMTYINSHYDASISVGRLASMCAVSSSRFHRLFQNAFNVSPLEYQIRLRMKEAQKLLLFSDLNIAEIASKTGYPDQFHFSRTFKSRCGESPLKYRTSSEKGRYTL